MYLYKGYCYETSVELGDEIMSSLVYFDNTNVQYKYQDVYINTPTQELYIDHNPFYDNTILYRDKFDIPSCDIADNLVSYTGLSVADSIELSWLMIAAIAAAWSIKILRRAL